MAEDARNILDDAARRRLACRVLTRGGDWVEARFVRVDKAGVVLVAPGAGFAGGEDVRVWVSVDDVARSFDAAILRVGVPVPDRSQHGLMLGFIDGWRSEEDAPKESVGAILEVLPHVGRGLNLLGGGSRLIDISTVEMSFTVPAEVALKFVEGGQVELHYEEGGVSQRMSGTVRKLSAGDGHLLYALSFDTVENEKAHLEAIESLRRFC